MKPVCPLCPSPSGTRTALAKHDWRFDHARARVIVGEPIPTTDLEEADMERLMKETRDQIESLRETLRRSLSET